VKAAVSGAKAPEEIVSKALDSLKAASALLDAKGGADGAPFRTWLAGVAKSVAEAAPEGGFLGFGGGERHRKSDGGSDRRRARRPGARARCLVPAFAGADSV
jgi:hypothetical protein